MEIDADDFELMLMTMQLQTMPFELRKSRAEALKYLTLAYICGLQAVARSLNTDDPLQSVIQSSLSEIETMLMDR